MSFAPALFSGLGHLSRELFRPDETQEYGVGKWQFENQRASAGNAITLTHFRSTPSVSRASAFGVSGAYNYKEVEFSGSVRSDDQVELAAASELAEGLDVTLSGQYQILDDDKTPDSENRTTSAALAFEYKNPQYHFSAEGKGEVVVEEDETSGGVELALVGEYEGVSIGAAVSASSLHSDAPEDKPKFNVGASYSFTAADKPSVLTFLLRGEDELEDNSVLRGHCQVSDEATVGVELNFKQNDEEAADIGARVGGTYQFGDSSVKGFVDNEGQIQFAYTRILSSEARVTLSSKSCWDSATGKFLDHDPAFGLKLSLGDF